MLRRVGVAGFDPGARERVRGDIRHIFAERHVAPLDTHFARHVQVRQEWPEGTTREQYIDNARALVRDPSSGVFVSRYGGTLQLGVVGRTPVEGRGGLNEQELLLVEYRASLGHWVTVHQLRDGIEGVTGSPYRENMIWLREMRLEENEGTT